MADPAPRRYSNVMSGDDDPLRVAAEKEAAEASVRLLSALADAAADADASSTTTGDELKELTERFTDSMAFKLKEAAEAADVQPNAAPAALFLALRRLGESRRKWTGGDCIRAETTDNEDPLRVVEAEAINSTNEEVGLDCTCRRGHKGSTKQPR